MLSYVSLLEQMLDKILSTILIWHIIWEYFMNKSYLNQI
jgi:hypothetical protein